MSKSHYPPCCHRVPACQSRLKVCVDRSASLSIHLLKLASWRRTFYRCSHGFCACNTVYSILKVREGDGGNRTFHLTRKISRFYPLFWPSLGKIFSRILIARRRERQIRGWPTCSASAIWVSFIPLTRYIHRRRYCVSVSSPLTCRSRAARRSSCSASSSGANDD